MSADDFAWEILADAVEEDGQMLYEPLAAARARMPDAAEDERQAVTERTLRALAGAGLIAFFREEDDAGGRTPLGDDELEEVLAGRGWRTVPPGRDGSAVWLRATAAGTQALQEEAPAEIRERGAGGDAA